ncbi:tail sheath initiator protein [Pseudomonas phage vB_PseuGesM_254]|uniref:Tail sheath initiator protein n=1 Tax=Pseudomonas phage vB_PseuGesM_254 TaxID=3092638 RepID=A0AAX4G6F3_9CAUD|nr:tail sheath initiator protein [Pseudomonas phage PseuGes_254]
MDILLDPVSHDVVFVNGETTVTRKIADIVAQRLKITLYTFLGEWFLDLDVGMPYFQQILNKVRNKSTVDVIFQTVISKDPDVIEIISYYSDMDNATRGFYMEFSVRVSDGTITPPINISLGI